MEKGASQMERFIGWFVEPIELLKRELPEGDGAFITLSTAIFLCERYYRALTNTLYRKRDNAFKIEAAKDLGISPDVFKCFWRVYRDGVQHQGTPKVYFDKKTNIKYIWEITNEIEGIVELCKKDDFKIEIRLDVWKFADFIFDKFKTNSEVFQKAISSSFPTIL